MKSISMQELQEKRDHILDQIRDLDQMRRGSLSQQFFAAAKSGDSRTGPYFVLQGYLQGQKFSERIPADQAPSVQAQVDNYKRFQKLADEFVTVTEQLTLQENADSKKNSAKRSNMSVSGKPARSSA